jgi:hypothetical protein
MDLKEKQFEVAERIEVGQGRVKYKSLGSHNFWTTALRKDFYVNCNSDVF